jgi:hypothetical protein
MTKTELIHHLMQIAGDPEVRTGVWRRESTMIAYDNPIEDVVIDKDRIVLLAGDLEGWQ